MHLDPASTAAITAGVHVAAHPMIQHKLGLMREAGCPSSEFRRLLGEIAMLLCYEVTRDLPLEQVPIETPLEPMMAPRIAGRKLANESAVRTVGVHHHRAPLHGHRIGVDDDGCSRSRRRKRGSNQPGSDDQNAHLIPQ